MSGRSFIVLCALTLTIAACGGSTPTRPTAPPAAGPAAVLHLTIDSVGSQEAVAAVSEVTADAGPSTGTDLRYRIDFGDGSVSADRVARHVYDTPGTYRLTLTVTDAHNLTAAASRDVVVGSPLGLWVHSGYFEGIRRVEVRALEIVSQDGGTIRGALTKDGTNRTPFSGTISNDRQARIVLEGMTEALEGPVPSVLTADGTGWSLSLRGGVLDGSTTTFRRVVGQPAGPPPDADLRMRFFSFGAPFAVRQISPVLFDASSSRGDSLSTYMEFGDGQVATEATATHPIDKVGSYTARLTVVDRFGRSDSESAPYRVFELTDQTDASYWLGTNRSSVPRDAYDCVVGIKIATQQGSAVTGNYWGVVNGNYDGATNNPFVGTVSPTGEVRLALTGTDVTLSGTLAMPGSSIWNIQNRLTLTYRGGQFDGIKVVLQPYSSY